MAKKRDKKKPSSSCIEEAETSSKSKKAEAVVVPSTNSKSRPAGPKAKQTARSIPEKTEPQSNVSGDLNRASKKGKLSPAVRCAENIALLALLAQILKTPTTYEPKQPSQERRHDVKRVLSNTQESDLATKLAYITAISNNCSHIMAVCIEELPEVGGCQVSIAINSCGSSTEHGTLTRVQLGFQQMFGRLRDISPATRVAVENAVFNDIVVLCRKKIISHLSRTRSAGLLLKSFIGMHWQERIDKPDPEMAVPQLEQYQGESKNLSMRLTPLNEPKAISNEDLLSQVGRIASLMQTVPLAKLLGALTNRDMQPMQREELLGCLSRIASYRECASFLCQEAIKHPILRNTVVQQVQNEAQSGQHPQTTVDLGQSLRRFQYEGKPIQIDSLPEWLRNSALFSQRSFSDDVSKILKKAKVHAEIQLLSHYENVSDRVVPPRILASSKQPCPLCHSLIRLHGRYEVPKSHGILYKNWRLPVKHQDGSLQHSLNLFLEKQISTALKKLMGLPRKP